MAETDREGAKKIATDLKTRVLHEGRPDVERVVPVIAKHSRVTD
jgi:excinuclease ABC subunit C